MSDTFVALTLPDDAGKVLINLRHIAYVLPLLNRQTQVLMVNGATIKVVDTVEQIAGYLLKR